VIGNRQVDVTCLFCYMLITQDRDIQFLEENIIHRYEKPKSVWELMAVSPVKKDIL